MATRKTPVQKATMSALDKPEKFQLSSIGYTGVRMLDGVMKEELDTTLDFPNNIKVYKEMSYHPAINAALSLYQTMVSKATFRIVEPKNATAKERKQAKIINEMLHDMETPLEDVITDIMTMTVYGFSVMEKVYRRRNKASGSMYTDGLIGIRKIAYRNQESIDKFIFDDNGNELLGVKQDLSRLNDPYQRYKGRSELTVVLPKSKVMLFNLGRGMSNPFGVSPLRDVHLPWKYLTAIEQLEAEGVAKDLQGLPVLQIPAQYMSEDASPEQKAIYEQFKNIIRNLQTNSQSGLILPSAVDPDTRQPLFKLDLLSTEGGKKNFDTSKVKDYYRTMIFIGMNADILLMGNTQTGSFALGSIKTSMTGSYVEGILKKIVRVFNDDLIKQIYELNGWDVTRRCVMDYEGFEDADLESFSKAIQRMAAVSMLPRTPEVVNQILTQLGLDELPPDTDLDSLFPQEMQSRSGDGMVEGMPSGTGEATGDTGDASSNNADNAA